MSGFGAFNMYPWDYVPEQYYDSDCEEDSDDFPYPIPANYYCYGEVWEALGLDELTGIDKDGDPMCPEGLMAGALDEFDEMGGF
tara:strand:+ start:3508 stop:3759 length:252 start_codon:yes stop_codon:yes gene_type:complete